MKTAVQVAADPFSTAFDADIARLETLNTAQLKAELSSAIIDTAKQIVRMAAIIRILEDRGDDLSEMRVGMMGYLRKVAHRQLLPEALAKLWGHSRLLTRVASLPLPDQRKVVSGAPIRLMIVEDGHTTHRLCDPLKMTTSEIVQVLDHDHIRDDAEQVSWLRDRAPRNAHRVNAEAMVQIDGKRKGIVVKVGDEEVFIKRADLMGYLARISD